MKKLLNILLEYGGKVNVKELPPFSIDVIKQSLTILERDYMSDEIVPFVYFLEQGDFLYFPTYFVKDFKKIMKEQFNIFDFNIIDKRDVGKSLSYNKLCEEFSFRQEEKQEYYVNETLKYETVIVKRPPGSGKTIIGAAISIIRNSRTLILCNQIELISQWEKALNIVSGNKLKISINNILKDEDNSYDIYIATVQGLLSYYSKHGFEKTKSNLDKYGIGQIIFDECHLLIGPEKFSLISFLFRSKYRVGLSATPVRDNDKSKMMINYWLGYNVIGKSDYNVIPIVKIIQYKSGLSKKTKYDAKGKRIPNRYWYINWQKRDTETGRPIGYPKLFINRYFTYLFQQECFLKLCYQFIYASFHQGRQILVITHLNKKGVYILYEYLKKRFKNISEVGIFIGTTPKDKREDIKKKPVILSNYKILSTGVDIPTLDTLLMCTPLANIVDLEQTVGRILRKHDKKKTPLILDLFDVSFSEKTKRWLGIRSSFYKKNKFHYSTTM